MNDSRRALPSNVFCVELTLVMLIVFGLLVPANRVWAQSGVSAADAARFLEQASFGPVPATDPTDPNYIGSVTHVQELGFSGWLNEQFGLPLPADYVGIETCPTATGRCPDQPPMGCGGGTT